MTADKCDSPTSAYSAAALLRRRLADLGIPRAREATGPGLLTREDVVVDRPLGARHLVEHFDAVAVGVAQIDAERDAVVDDALYRLFLGLTVL